MTTLIPVSVITGFLGSGKTTLLANLLRDPTLGRTAVLMNEFGEIGLDHDLIETSDDTFVQLSTGCLCCNVKSDFVLALGDLGAAFRALSLMGAQGKAPPQGAELLKWVARHAEARDLAIYSVSEQYAEARRQAKSGG